jgi:hypothetical protein
MDLYVVVGNSNTRRASVVRSLTGCFNRSLRDIQPLAPGKPLRMYARVGALQETKTTPQDFIAEATKTRCDAVLCCLSASHYPGGDNGYPDAQAYLLAFKEAGWRVQAVAVLGQNSGGIKSPHMRQFPQATTAPINVTAQEVRALFGWR